MNAGNIEARAILVISKKKSLPAPLTILMMVIVLSAICTWIVPAGRYDKLSAAADSRSFSASTPSGAVQLPFTQHTLDSLQIRIALQKFKDGSIRKPVSIPGTYKKLPANPQGLIRMMQAPVKGIIDSIDVGLFILVIGGFMYVFNATGAMNKGVEYLLHSMKGREPVLILTLLLIFAFLRATMGMEEESLVFIPILTPLFLAAGYDLLVPVTIVFGGTTAGGIAAITNPFTVIIASNAAGISWTDGIYQRMALFVIVISVLAWYLLRYAVKVKNNPQASLVLQIDGAVLPPYDITVKQHSEPPVLTIRTKILLLLYLLTFLTMIGGIILLDWWTIEMSAFFLGAAILTGIVTRMREKVFLAEFIKGCEAMLGVALIVGVARGITIVLNDGYISDSLLFYASGMVQHVPPAVFIVLLLVFYFFFAFFITSSSGMAALTMPVMGALAVIINIPGREIVNSYTYGINLMFLVAPTSTLLPALGLVNVSYKTWMRFITPLLAMLAIICAVFLIVGINI